MTYIPTWKDRLKQRNDHARQMLQQVSSQGQFTPDPEPEYDWAAKAEQVMHNAMNKYSNPTPQFKLRDTGGGAPVAGGGNFGNTGSPKGQLAAFINAIAGKESGGNYRAVNQHSGALGKYQIMPGNIPSWSKEALGRSISTQEFLNNPKLQEQIARYKLTQYFRKYGPRGAASAWYSGDPNKWNSRTPQGGYPSIHAYVMDILKRMGAL